MIKENISGRPNLSAFGEFGIYMQFLQDQIDDLKQVRLEECAKPLEQSNKEFYSIQELADLMGHHYNTLYKKVRSGEIKSVKSGGHYRIRKSSFEDFIEYSS